jgi:hypothetical protein
MGVALQLLKEKSLSTVPSDRIIADAAMRHDLRMHFAPGFGPPQVR